MVALAHTRAYTPRPYAKIINVLNSFRGSDELALDLLFRASRGGADLVEFLRLRSETSSKPNEVV